MPKVYVITEINDDGSEKQIVQIDTSLPVDLPMHSALNSLLDKILSEIVEKNLKLDGVQIRQI